MMNPVSRRSLLKLAGALTSFALPSRAVFAASSNQHQVFVGTFTNASGEKIPAEFGNTGRLSKGLYSFNFDSATGKISELKLAAELTNPMNLTMSPDKRFLYACRGQSTRVGDQNAITAFAIEGNKVRELNTVACGGGGPTVGAVDKAGNFLLTTNFATSSIVSFRLNKDGSLGELVSLIGNKPGENKSTAGGPGDAPKEQDPTRTKPHAIIISNNQRFAIAAEIDGNRLHVLRFDATTGKLATHQLAPCIGGAGPRHLNLHPSGRFIYSANETGASISAWAWDEASGQASHIQTVGSAPAGSVKEHPADVALHPSGKFAYITNRTTGTLAGFRIDQTSGKLSPIGHAKMDSVASWSMIFDPTGRWALNAEQVAGKVKVYAVHPDSGELVANGEEASVTYAICLRMA